MIYSSFRKQPSDFLCHFKQTIIHLSIFRTTMKQLSLILLLLVIVNIKTRPSHLGNLPPSRNDHFQSQNRLLTSQLESNLFCTCQCVRKNTTRIQQLSPQNMILNIVFSSSIINLFLRNKSNVFPSRLRKNLLKCLFIFKIISNLDCETPWEVSNAVQNMQ